MMDKTQERLLKIKHVFLDMDGTIYHGTQLFPTTIPFLDFLKGQGIGYTFLTNNSSYGPEEYIARLNRFGIKVGAENFYISSDYTVDYLKRNMPEVKRVYVLGMPCLARIMTEAGFDVVEEDPQAVIVGFDRELVYSRLCQAAWFMRNDIPAIATHPDVFCPTDQPTWLVDCGALIACLEKATNKKIKVLGKPDPGLLVEAAARKGVDVTETMMCGDRLSTDISLGVNAGALTCHIATPGADLIVPEGIVPDFSVLNLGEMQAIWEKALS